MEVKPRLEFLKFHQGSVRGVAFSPVDRYIFCSGAYDGKVNVYSANKCQLLGSYPVSALSLARNVNAVRFTSDGERILAGTTARRLIVIDVETGEQLATYDNCVFNGRDRTGLAVDYQNGPHIAVSTCVDGRGLSIFDLRMPLPLDFLHDFHNSTIRDVIFLHDSWPWCKGQSTLFSVSVDGTAKVTTLDGRSLQTIDVESSVHSVAATPEVFGSMADEGFYSLIMLGGESLTAFVPEVGIQESLKEHGEAPLWKIRYTSNGSSLFTACDSGYVRKYRRFPDHHQYVSEVFKHTDDIEDMDISPYDEFLVTASQDKTVGVYTLGGPNHGSTEYCELT